MLFYYLNANVVFLLYIFEDFFYMISIVIVAIVLKSSKCSLVIDGLSQNAVYVADYCPKMKYCVEGAHVMCMYYNPHKAMGPRCSSPQNVSVTPGLATKLLDISNALRSKLAQGQEKGRNGERLPRAYGMFRLRWDNELATFAQVLANQCVLRHDLCRATSRFPDPGQTAGLVRFTYPDWYPVSRSGQFKTPGLNTPKIEYAVMQTLKSWYGHKNSVTESMLQKYPDWSLTPNNQGGRLYLEMISSSATHMGCGISAYTGYAYYDNNAPLNYNYVQVICNYSAKPRKGAKVFEMNPPVGPGYTSQCGCPAGSREDVDCLCNEYDRIEQRKPLKNIGRTCDGIGDDCKPTMVLLPIFTIEDAPPQKLFNKDIDIQASMNSYLRQRFPNTSIGRSQKSQEIYDFFLEAENDQSRSIAHGFRTTLNVPLLSSKETIISRQAQRGTKKNTDIMHRQYNMKSVNPVKRQQYLKQPQKISTRKTSIFTRAAKFQLPARRDEVVDVVVKKDVAPRKDFSNVRKLVNNYLMKRRTGDVIRKSSNLKNHDDHINTDFYYLDDDKTTETILNKAEENIMSYNQYDKQKLNITDDRKMYNKLNEENENKLLSLLDTLEREVKLIELDGNEKEIFDTKLRKIYGTVVGKPVELLNLNQIKAGESDLHTDLQMEKELTDLTHLSDDDKLKHDTKRLTTEIRKYDNNNIIYDEVKVDTHFNVNRNNYDELDSKRSRPIKTQPDESVHKKSREYLSSDENLKSRYDKFSDLELGYKTNLEDIKRRSTSDAIKNKAHYSHKDEDKDDPLSIERRKYYQDKLQNLEKRLHDIRNHKHRNEHVDRQMRRMRPSRDDTHVRASRSKSQIDTFYMPDRARYVHGY